MFDKEDNNFEIIHNGVTMEVQRLDLPGHIAFKIIFSGVRKSIIIARTENESRKFWTSIPEGRQKEAEGVGALIEDYFKNKK
jgi:hypothetical protein